MKSPRLYQQLVVRLRQEQSAKRFAHSISVGALAAKLGQRYGWDPARARLAGLLHDYAKEWSTKKLKKYVRKRELEIPGKDLILKISPNMLHAYVSADVVRRKMWIKEKKDLKAIASHTLGSPKMKLEEKILYIADFAAPGRTYPSAARVRKMAMTDLDQAFREALSLKIFWQLKKTKAIHPVPIQVWNRVVCGIKTSLRGTK